MLAIFKRELRAYFTSPMGYVFIAVFLVISNLFFYLLNIYGQTSDLTSLFSNMLFMLLFIVPLLTMRSLSEESKQQTDQLLLTAPINIVSIVLGKFFAAMVVFLIGLLGTLAWPVIISMYGVPLVETTVGNYVALIFAATTLISMGIFISSLTKSQIVAAILSYCAFLAIYFLQSIAMIVDQPFIQNVLNWFSIFARYQNLAVGIFSLSDIVYYVSYTVVFLFLTTRVIEKKRWA